MAVCVETCCLHSWFHILWFSSLWKESCSSIPGLLHYMQSVGTIKKSALHMYCWAALKIWGSCIFKSIVSSRWLTLNFTSWHCSVRGGMNTTTNCVAFMVLSSVTRDGRKFLVRCFYVVCFMQVHWLMACNAYMTRVQKLWIFMLYKWSSWM